MAAVPLGEGINHVGCLLKVIWVTAAVIIKQSQFLWDSGKENNLREKAFREFINHGYVLRADSQRNKMITFSYHNMPFLSIKSLLLFLPRLKNSRVVHDEDWWVLPLGSAFREDAWREQKGLWNRAEGVWLLTGRGTSSISLSPSALTS